MATCTVKLPDELMNQLNELDKHTEEIVSKSLEAGAKVVYQKAQSNLNAVIKGTGSGQLKNALGISPVKHSKSDGYDIKIGFSETRTDGKTNAMVANILEYGSKKHNQAAKPFMKPALNASKKSAEAEIKKAFDEEAQKYLKSRG